MQYIVEPTGPDWQPTKETQWYAQEQIPPPLIGRFAFGRTPQEALDNLIKGDAK